MLISTTTDAYTAIGSISTSIFADFFPYIALITGVVVGFFVIERILHAVYPHRYIDNENDSDNI